MTAASRRFLDHVAWARSIARRWHFVEDVEQAALLGLHLADLAAPPDMSESEFLHYASVRVRGEAIDHIRRVAHGGRYQGPLATKPHQPEPESVAMAQDMGLLPQSHSFVLIARELDPEAQAIAAEDAREQQALLDSIHTLPARTQVILRRRLAGDSVKAIAEDVGISQPRVSQVVALAVAALRAR